MSDGKPRGDDTGRNGVGAAAVGADPVGASRDALVRSAARLLGSREAGEDVVQEAALRGLERLAAGAPPPEVPGAWLATVARRLAIDRLRRERLERAGLETGRVDAPDDAGAGPQEALLAAERRRAALVRLLEVAAARDVAAVLLREAFGVGYADIARTGARDAAAWRQAVHRALERARRGGRRPAGRRPGGASGGASAAPARADRSREGTDGADGRAATVGVSPAARGALADAVLDRFDRALAERDARPLFDELRVDAIARHGSSGASVRVELDACRTRLSLVLGGVVLCRLEPPERRAVPVPARV